MPRFRYEAVDRTGVPVHGTTDVDDESALADELSSRGLKLISSAELSLESLVGTNERLLPRLQQLRVGEQLREALLTGLPAHVAVRAIAAEPLSHPMLGVAPWLQVMSTLIFVVLAVAWRLLGMFDGVLIAAGLFAFVVVPLIWVTLQWLYCIRPKQMLRLLADRLESGQRLPTTLHFAMPRELQNVMQSEIDDEHKARVAGDLIPTLLGSNLRGQQFVMTLIGPIVLFSVVMLGVHSAMLFIIPRFKRIFEDFGTELPAFTELVVGISDSVAWFGSPGWLAMALLLASGLILLAIGLSSGWAAEFLESIPVFGIAFRWAMQARVARILAAMVRNDCDYAESIRTATAGSGFESVRAQGRLMAEELETQSGEVLTSRQLSGLPLSMLYVGNTETEHKERRTAIADTFQSLAEMLDAATVGQGRLLSVLIQFLTILFTAFIVAFGVLAMFLPLIKLLNDLS